MDDLNDSGRFDKLTDKKFTLLDAEDEIISIFCQNNGGMEFAMPIIRKQFKDAGIDFTKPTKSDLLIVIKKLVKITSELQGEQAAKEEFQDYMHILNRIPD
jgi:hypothetical protein